MVVCTQNNTVPSFSLLEVLNPSKNIESSSLSNAKGKGRGGEGEGRGERRREGRGEGRGEGREERRAQVMCHVGINLHCKQHTSIREFYEVTKLDPPRESTLPLLTALEYEVVADIPRLESGPPLARP